MLVPCTPQADTADDGVHMGMDPEEETPPVPLPTQNISHPPTIELQAHTHRVSLIRIRVRVTVKGALRARVRIRGLGSDRASQNVLT